MARFLSTVLRFGALFEPVEHSSLHSVGEFAPADHGVHNLEDKFVGVLLLLKVVEDTVLGHLGTHGKSKMRVGALTRNNHLINVIIQNVM